MNRFLHRAVLVAASGLFCIGLAPNDACGQAGLRESLELLDRNENGYIDPDEVTSLARPYLERIAQPRRMSLDRPNRIDKLQEAARIYYALKNGVAGERVRASGESTLRDFRPRDEDPIVPEFGLAKVKYPYQQQDLDEADETLARYDRDRDGSMSRYEAARARWTHRDPFEADLNKDDQLSRLELAQRYARRRMLSNDSSELIQRSRRVGNGIEPSKIENEGDRRRRERNEWWSSGGDRYWLTAAVLGRFDSNRNGRLEMEETTRLGIPVGAVDADQNGELSRDELFAYFQELQDQTGDQIEGLPGWFYELDTNRDKQVDLTEFATELTDERVAEFVALDSNQDGLLAPSEILTSKSMMGGTFKNGEAEMLPPKKTIVSEIEISEDFIIADLNLRLTLTHTNVSALDGYLTGPDGTRIELFTAVGGRDDHFERTVFDDQAGTPIIKARPPFEGSFQPEGLAKRQPGLGAFNGKSIAGVWQLTIRCSRSERFGMLHSWSLIARPDEESLLDTDDTITPSAEDEAPAEPIPADAASQTQYRSPEPIQIETTSRNQYAKVATDFWTPERKAEYAEKLRKPSSEQWESMGEDERQAYLANRSKVIAEYKAALNHSFGDNSPGKKELKQELKRQRN